MYGAPPFAGQSAGRRIPAGSGTEVEGERGEDARLINAQFKREASPLAQIELDVFVVDDPAQLACKIGVQLERLPPSRLPEKQAEVF